jgi:hypothetical protein
VAVDKPAPVTGAYLFKDMKNLQTAYTSAQLGKKAKLLTYDELKAMAQKVGHRIIGTRKNKRVEHLGGKRQGGQIRTIRAEE